MRLVCNFVEKLVLGIFLGCGRSMLVVSVLFFLFGVIFILFFLRLNIWLMIELFICLLIFLMWFLKELSVCVF